MLCFLQAVLGFDNLLYISIESRSAPVAQQKAVRSWGIIIAVALRVVLLFTMIQLIDSLSEPFIVMNWNGVIEDGVNFASIVFVFGGAFIMYTAIKEIVHMLSMDNLAHDVEGKGAKSVAKVVMLIVLIKLIFSFDSVLSALAITNVFPILATVIILSGLAMLLLADGETIFLGKNRMYQVLDLFILLIVSVVLLGKAGPAAAHAMHDDSLQILVFGQDIIPMSKSTFYISVLVLVAVEIIQSGYTRKLNAARGTLQKHS
jgi:predicted tellurium resistance membrane protein TerC